MPKYIFVYQTKNLINGKTYIGVHSTDILNDGYIGCGIFSNSDARKNLLFHKAVKKYGYASFERHILSFYDTYQEALEEEKYLVNKKWVRLNSNYNAAIGGAGNTVEWMDEKRKNEWKSKISESIKIWLKNGGYEKVKISSPKNARKMFGDKNPMFNTRNPSVQRSVIQYDKEMNFIKKFDNLTDAAKEVGAFISSITFCCKGRYSSCKGYIFRYEKYSDEELLKMQCRLNERKLNKLQNKTKQRQLESLKLNGRKNSIKLINSETGEILQTLGELSKLYPSYSYFNIHFQIKRYGKFLNWTKINGR